jgi:hypothetical protein
LEPFGRDPHGIVADLASKPSVGRGVPGLSNSAVIQLREFAHDDPAFLIREQQSQNDSSEPR